MASRGSAARVGHDIHVQVLLDGAVMSGAASTQAPGAMMVCSLVITDTCGDMQRIPERIPSRKRWQQVCSSFGPWPDA